MKQSTFSLPRLIDRTCSRIGDGLSILIMMIMIFTAVEVILRYLFNSPTAWVWPLNRQIFGVYILFAGIYAMSKRSHIRIEIFQNLLPRQCRPITKILSLMSFSCFVGVLIIKGAQIAKMSWLAGETAHGAFRIPLYPLKILIPVASVLFLVEGIIILSRSTPPD